jgi:hypothetical protein
MSCVMRKMKTSAAEAPDSEKSILGAHGQPARPHASNADYVAASATTM